MSAAQPMPVDGLLDETILPMVSILSAGKRCWMPTARNFQSQQMCSTSFMEWIHLFCCLMISDISVLNSSEGPRQESAAGSHSFALTIHPLLVELQAKYTEFEIRVLTDDIIP